MSLFLGVDPGKHGAAVAINHEGKFVGFCPAAWEGDALSETCIRWLLKARPFYEGAAIEEPIMFFGRGKPVPKSAQAVAMSVGQWRGAMAAVGIRGVRLVRPQTWQARMLGKFPKGESKAASMRWAAQVFGAEIEKAIEEYGDAVSDAAAIAEWVRLEINQMVREAL